MHIEEKLQHFYETVMEDSEKEANAALEAHQNHLNEMFDEYTAMQRQTADAEIKAETEHAFREVNKTLSSEQLSLKRSWTQKQMELKNKLFREVRELLDTFMSSPEYDRYLEAKIQEAKNFAGNDEFFLYLSEGDRGKAEDLSARTGLPIQISEEPFLGGIRTTIPQRNILIDDSFQAALSVLYKNFKFDGGLNK